MNLTADNSRLAPPDHSWVSTEDGSFTLLNHHFNEHCHSLAGAREETRHHYLEGCQVPCLLEKYAPLKILEVGFGTGLGWEETAQLVQQLGGKLDFVSLEIDEDLVKWVIPQGQRHEADNLVWYEFHASHARLRVLVGDARQTLPRLNERFHAIYQDAFSPRKNRTLWTEEWFKLLASKSHPQAKLSTYSASISIRKALIASGWGISNGAPFGTKRRSTRAELGSATAPAILSELALSPIPSCQDSL